MKKSQKVIYGGYFLLAAVAIMFLATRSSILYPCNNWDDANSYFSVGKALFHGKMPYRDVFDQKGMYLYFFYGLCYLISHTTFRGVFLMEILLAFWDLAGIFHILNFYVKKSTALILTPLTLAVCFCSYSFYYGGAAEEICFPFLIWGLYLGIRYFKEGEPGTGMKKSTLFVAGLLAGMVANIKFTVLGFFFAWMMMVAFSYLARKDFWGAVKACGWFLLGMLLPFIPWFFYFAIRGGLYYWYWGYVYINVFSYSNLNGAGPSLGERVYTLAKILYYIILKNWTYYIFLIPGFFYGSIAVQPREKKQKTKKWLAVFFVPSLAFFLFLGIYIGGSELPYYALPLGVFTVFGFALLGRLAERLLPSFFSTTGVCVAAMTASVMVSMMVIWCFSMNIPFRNVKQEDIFLFQFRDVVMQTENPTLLNVGCLDAGLYTVCDIVPTCQWFQTQTIHMQEVYDEQKRYIKEGLIDYVIARDGEPEKIHDRYELASEAVFEENGYPHVWYLYRLKEKGKS